MTEATLWRLALSTLLLIAVATDLRWRRIPNLLVLTVLAIGVLHAALAAAPSAALLAAGLGGLVGLALWMPAFAFGVLGAGDVKLFAAIAVWLGPAQGAYAALVVAVVGGLLGGVWMMVVRRRQSTQSATKRSVSRRRTLPYGVAIAVGTLAVTWGIA